MLNNWIIIITVLVVALGLIAFLISQNQKDKKEVTKYFNTEFPDPEFIEEEELNDER